MISMSDQSLISSLGQLARAKRSTLPPAWESEIDLTELEGSLGDVAHVCRAMSWAIPVAQKTRPRPEQMPVLIHHPTARWCVAEQWTSEDSLQIIGSSKPLSFDDEVVFFEIKFPDPSQTGSDVTARHVFWQAIMRRKPVLISAALATVCANLLALATSLYSMQIFDRVIPLASYGTLVVLTVGTLVGIGFDFILRTIRSLMIEREAAQIDFEVSEFFFSRAQAVRMDARPPGVGTLAAQLRGLEQVRSVMSSGSLFLVADLPFALFFIFVILMIGGPVAYVPLVSLPIALFLAYLLAAAIRKQTEQAQVSGNRKNGLLVESLDAVETIKSSRGEWFLLARWNKLVREVHNYEDPIKRVSAVAQSVFQILQQVAYVGIMALGAYEVGEGRMTSGALLACSIIGGRVNGPLIAQLPNFIVQWGYAKSSLMALDSILKLPTEQSASANALRPDRLKGQISLDGVRFSYPGSKEGLEIPQMAIPEGTRVAIIGGIGSGKTTLLRVLSGLYRPQSGALRIGPLDVGQVADDVLRKHVGYLAQDYRLINGTLRDNLLLGLGSMPDDLVLAAAAKTGLDQTIAAHERGLDLPIQEGGAGVSGGQRTLVGLTRLMLINPALWLLDEPTANLDANSEAKFMALLRSELDADRTLVVVTHKLQLLGHFDRIVVMARGRVVIDGPRDEVLRRMQASSTEGAAAAKVAPLYRTTS